MILEIRQNDKVVDFVFFKDVNPELVFSLPNYIELDSKFGNEVLWQRFDLNCLTQAISDELKKIYTDALENEYPRQDNFNPKKLNMIATPFRESNRTPKISKIKDIAGFVYLAKCEEYYKIGRTINSAAHRVRKMSFMCPFPITLIYQFASPVCNRLEYDLQARFESKKIHGEWFRLDSSDVSYLTSIKDGATALP
jgi:hypothetical protein